MTFRDDIPPVNDVEDDSGLEVEPVVKTYVVAEIGPIVAPVDRVTLTVVDEEQETGDSRGTTQ